MNDFENDENLEDYGITKKEPKKSAWRRFAFGSWILILVVILVGVGGALVYKTSFTFSQIQTEDIDNLGLTENMTTPLPESDRLNILLLGLRGEGDPNGGLLTDSIMVLSVKKSTGQVALISIPRDLYVVIPGTNKKDKINYAYALGFEKKGAAGALLFSKIAVAQTTGLYMDRAISVDHQALKDIINTLGGVAVELNNPLVEDQQWTNGGDAGESWAFHIKTETATTTDGVVEKQKWVFEIPAGASLLDGNTALYFVRARYSTSDFDRLRRQQIVLAAIKDKALSLGILANPIKLFQIMDSLGRNVRTDMDLNDFKKLIALADNLKTQLIIHKIFDTTGEGLLTAGHAESGAYILLPQGDNFSKIQEACKNIFN
ncbi:LCP family protein [Patescibacteria group bacterium]|nr:LCP family protein [Patescibacteria group bacterium]MBU2220164.1 LCP family protein [Patescibacteria group bacterium]MBU2265033.1 LCP family protein [Patescibacteria group bacterium]